MVQEIHKMSLEHLRVPEIKEVLKTKTTHSRGISEVHRSQPEELPVVKAGRI